MLILMQRYLVIGMTALLVACSTTAPVSVPDADRQLSDALEEAMPLVLSSKDYWSASKLYFQLATVRSRLKEPAAACTALSQSLAYYVKALVKDTGADEGAVGSNNEGLAELRSRFGCATTWPALSDGSTASLEQALPSLVSSGDYRSASQLYFRIAEARNRSKETAAACTALLQSLAYYRKALAKAAGAPLEETANVGNDEGLAEVRSKFGCTNIRPELSAGLEASRH